MNLYQKINQGIKRFNLLEKNIADSSYVKSLTDTVFIHAGGENASDTEDLFNGRGLTEDKPFASLRGAIEFASNNYYSSRRIIVIVLHDDMTFTNEHLSNHGISIQITSDSVRRKITFADKRMHLQFTNMTFNNVSIDMNNYCLMVNGWTRPSSVLMGNVDFSGNKMSITLIGKMSSVYVNGNLEFNGTVDPNGALFHVDGGLVCLRQSVTLSGNVTGKRYECVCGGCIVTGGKGPDFIPGTIEGTCDANSFYE